MLTWLKNSKLINILATFFTGFVLLAFINYLVINNYIKALEKDVVNINAATRAEVLSQKVMLLLEKWEHDKSLENELISAINQHDHILKIFANGGLLSKKGKFVEPIDEPILSILNQSKILWDSIQNNIYIILDNHESIKGSKNLVTIIDSLNTDEAVVDHSLILSSQVTRAKNFINRKRDVLLERNNDLVQALAGRHSTNIDQLSFVILIFLLINTVMVIAVYIGSKNFIFKPLQKVSSFADRLSNGDLAAKIDYSLQNELGTIANGMNNLAANLDNAKQFIKRIEDGDLSDAKDNFDEAALNNDSIESALLKMREQMKVRVAEDEQRKWTTEGLAKFADILHSDDHVERLGDMILSKLVDYTKSNQAGIYLANDHEGSDKRLELVSLYAFDAKKYETKKVRLGEGLVGQTFLEKKTTYLLDVPDNYISITSGLGDANPKNILLVPLKVEEEIFGVLEIASFNEYAEHEIQFIEALAVNIATTISSVKTNQRTKTLLEESQQLTEQMQAQEEEMRQNMEELTATQEEMSRKEQAIGAQMETIDLVLGMVEYSANGDILSMNEKLITALGYQERNLSNLNFHDINDADSLFGKLQSGNNHYGWVAKKDAKDEKKEMNSYFNPIYNEEGTLVKIIEIITQFEQGTETGAADDTLAELEEELRQQCDALNITQSQLDKKIYLAEHVYKAMTASGNLYLIDESGTIYNKKIFGAENNEKHISEVIESDWRQFLDLEGSHKILLKNNELEVSATFKRLTIADEKYYLILWL